VKELPPDRLTKSSLPVIGLNLKGTYYAVLSMSETNSLDDVV
jgi:hypothetical protein